MPLFDSLGASASQNYRLSKMSSVPTTEDLKYALTEAQKRRKPVEMPFENPHNRLTFVVKVQIGQGIAPPTWTFLRGDGPNAKVMWTRATAEVMMIQSKVSTESNRLQDDGGGGAQADYQSYQSLSVSTEQFADNDFDMDSGSGTAGNPFIMGGPVDPGRSLSASMPADMPTPSNEAPSAPGQQAGFNFGQPQSLSAFFEEPGQAPPPGFGGFGAQPGFGAPADQGFGAPPGFGSPQAEAPQAEAPTAVAEPPADGADSAWAMEAQAGAPPQMEPPPPPPLPQAPPESEPPPPMPLPHGQATPPAGLEMPPPPPPLPAAEAAPMEVPPPPPPPPPPPQPAPVEAPPPPPQPEAAAPAPQPIPGAPPAPAPYPAPAAAAAAPQAEATPAPARAPAGPGPSTPLPAPVSLDRAAQQDVRTSLCDPQHKFFSAKSFVYFLLREHERFKKDQTPFSLVAFEIGIQYPDQVVPLPAEALPALSDRLQSACGPLDIMVPVGNGGFAVILPSTDAQGAVQYCQRLLTVLMETPLLPGADGQDMAKINVGCASIPQTCSDPEVLVAASLQAKDMAKQANQIFQFFP